MNIENQLRVELNAWFFDEHNLFYSVMNSQNEEEYIISRVLATGKMFTH